MASKIIQFISFLILISILTGCDNFPSTQKNYKIAVINPSKGLDNIVKGFIKGMEKKGYKKDNNITYSFYTDIHNLKLIEKEIKNKNFDLVYSLTTPATRKIKKVMTGTKIPLVFAPVYSPLDAGIVPSLSKPGNNITGIKMQGSTKKALGWLKLALPTTKRIFVPFHFSDHASNKTMDDLKIAALKFDIKIITGKFTTTADLDKVLANIPKNIDAVWIACSYIVFSNIDKIVQAATAQKLPVSSSTCLHKSGVAISYGQDSIGLGKQVSHLVDKVLKSNSPKNIPIETADFHLCINMKALNRLGIRISDEILRQSDVIER